MGRPIVYCAICGKSLREEDFSKGKAHVVDNASYCTGCRIVPEPLSKPAPAAKPTPTPPPVVPKPSGASSKALPSATPRRAHAPVADESSSLGLVIGIAVVVIAIVVLAIVLMSGSGPSSAPPALPTINAPPPPRAPDPVHPPAPAPVPRPEDDGQAAIRTLEAFASTSPDPQAVLDRCEELKPKLRGTPHLSRLEAVEARALEGRKVRDRERQLAQSLDNVKNLREFDKEFKKREEVESLLKAALDVAGTRKSEVVKILEDYRKE